ncbi:hypothetical protein CHINAEXTREME_01695 [Halobiforma lacisalsi AJ5]|uniref:Uncharacterized protein n=1 Tax=Natronobacterium lacisalsi AJ5 TaxID=358396 RepID=M0LF30_NATLA|nr:hypothetical protein [Halobiforma lacisalsi]APW96559.1 hypothetical protein CHINAEXTREME_01695 [Halobiforma lacisalsi AJ5]EMA32161.1 hypothetical protein C445_12641 [Halobiforma lacisalsi AJ5]
MVSRENRVIVGSFVLLVAAIALLTTIDRYLGVSLDQHPLPAFLVVVGVAVVLPQLYLAVTTPDDGEEVSPRARVRFAAVAIAAFAVMFAGGTITGLADLTGGALEDPETLQHLAILSVGALALVALVGYEFLDGYRSGSDSGSGSGSGSGSRSSNHDTRK